MAKTITNYFIISLTLAARRRAGPVPVSVCVTWKPRGRCQPPIPRARRARTSGIQHRHAVQDYPPNNIRITKRAKRYSIDVSSACLSKHLE